MHKSYQSILPCQSRILKERWDRKYYDEHRDKVRSAKAMVDTKAPTTYVHLHLKLKKLQLEEERYATIERDNRILLEKMAQIMRNRGRVDNHNNYVSKSLNREKRQRELLRVTRENQEILRRILAREPEYNHLQWEREWEENERFMDSIARFPRNWYELQQEEEERRKQELKERRKKEKQRSKSKTSGRSRTKSRETTASSTEESHDRDDASPEGEAENREERKSLAEETENQEDTVSMKQETENHDDALSPMERKDAEREGAREDQGQAEAEDADQNNNEGKEEKADENEESDEEEDQVEAKEVITA